MSLQEELSSGQIVSGRYRLERFLGAGGFAQVWRAHDLGVDRPVAVKLLSLSVMADAKTTQIMLERFEREARTSASIPHPNVVSIVDVGRVDGDALRPFIVMELLDGQDLQEHLAAHGAIEPARLWALFLPCLDALSMAHERGIIHKDLKPSNLFLSQPLRRGESLRLVDFGIAHIQGAEAAGAARLTSTGQIMGTPQYLPPEYINHQAVTPALDVYQMTLILAEALSGRQVVESESSLQCLLIHGDGRLEVPEYLLLSPVGPLLRRGLARDPAERYPDASALADAMRAISPASIPAAPPRGAAMPRRPLSQLMAQDASTRAPQDELRAPPSSRRTLRWALGGLITSGVLATGGIVAALWIAPGEQPAPPAAEQQAALTQRAMTPDDDEATRVLQGMERAEHEAPDVVAPGAPDPEDQAAASSPRTDELGVELEDEPLEALDELEDAPAKPRRAQDVKPRDEEDALAWRVKLRREAEAKIKTDPRGAIKRCEEAARLGEFVCYNIIMRSAWRPARRDLDLEAHACTVLKGLRQARPQDAIGINIQRKFMDCEQRKL